MRHELWHGDCTEWLTHLDEGHIACIFADPPDNIGLGYDAYKDNIANDEYVATLGSWLRLFCDKADTVWFSFNSRWLLDLAPVAKEIRDSGWEFMDCVQTFTFYRYNKKDLGNAHRPLWRFRKPGAGLYPEQAKIQSWRQLNGDIRAAKGGKVPGDHFDFPRVTGNSKQRRKWHPTQLHEKLVERCILLSTKPGDWVVDPFGGTGTTLRVCKELGDRYCTLIELDEGYCQKIAEEHDVLQVYQVVARESPCLK